MSEKINGMKPQEIVKKEIQKPKEEVKKAETENQTVEMPQENDAETQEVDTSKLKEDLSFSARMTAISDGVIEAAADAQVGIEKMVDTIKKTKLSDVKEGIKNYVDNHSAGEIAKDAGSLVKGFVEETGKEIGNAVAGAQIAMTSDNFEEVKDSAKMAVSDGAMGVLDASMVSAGGTLAAKGAIKGAKAAPKLAKGAADIAKDAANISKEMAKGVAEEVKDAAKTIAKGEVPKMKQRPGFFRFGSDDGEGLISKIKNFFKSPERKKMDAYSAQYNYFDEWKDVAKELAGKNLDPTTIDIDEAVKLSEKIQKLAQQERRTTYSSDVTRAMGDYLEYSGVKDAQKIANIKNSVKLGDMLKMVQPEARETFVKLSDKVAEIAKKTGGLDLAKVSNEQLLELAKVGDELKKFGVHSFQRDDRIRIADFINLRYAGKGIEKASVILEENSTLRVAENLRYIEPKERKSFLDVVEKLTEIGKRTEGFDSMKISRDDVLALSDAFKGRREMKMYEESLKDTLSVTAGANRYSSNYKLPKKLSEMTQGERVAFFKGVDELNQIISPYKGLDGVKTFDDLMKAASDADKKLLAEIFDFKKKKYSAIQLSRALKENGLLTYSQDRNWYNNLNT